MPGVICAIRGGPQSQPTILKAIGLAKERGITVYFMYVVNLDFLTHTISSRVQAVSDEMQRMGEFILLSAQEQAERQGVESEGLIRHGNVREEIIKTSQELQVDYVVLGRPKERANASVFDQERLESFGQNIQDETGAMVVYAGEAGE